MGLYTQKSVYLLESSIFKRETETLDKFEYKVKSDEIKTLISEGQYQRAVEIADEIDWRRVKSVMMLCTISDLYKMVRRYEDSRDLLLLAYERHPGGRTIVFSLCELFIKMGDVYQAVEYYKEYVAVAPKDSGRYILQYKLYEAQDVSLEERIAVLEEMKRKDYREKWAYELAYLYHRVGLATKCVEECDELILWFGDGKYVVKAMELKMLHQPLTAEQQAKYDMQTATIQKEELPKEQEASEEDIEVKQVGIGEYDTINLEKELAEGLREVLGPVPTRDEEITRSLIAPMLQETKNLPAEEILAQMQRDVMEAEELEQDRVHEDEMQDAQSEVFFGETGEVPVGVLESLEWQASETAPASATMDTEELITEILTQDEEPESVMDSSEEEEVQDTANAVMEAMRMEKTQPEKAATVEPPRELQSVLSMESDGQISLVVPESEAVEKQITGQISIEDVLAEWERMKKENEEKRKEEVRKRVLEQTGAMFTEFEAKIRDGLLEQLESGKISTPMATEAAAEVIPVPEETEEPEELFESEEDEVEELVEVDEIFEEDEESEEEELAEEEEIFEEDEIDEEEEDLEEDESDEEEEDLEEDEIDEEEEDLEEDKIDEEEEDLEEDESDEEEEDLEEDESDDEEETDDVSEEELLEEIEELPEEIDGDIEEGEADSEEEAKETASSVEAPHRVFTKEEKELFAPFVQGKASKRQLESVLDNITMAAYTGNVIVTGAEGVNTLGLAKNLVRYTQLTDGNFSGKTAKISAASLNTKEVSTLVDELVNGALIIQRAGEMNNETVDALYKALQSENFGILVVLEDTKKAMDRFIEVHPQLLNAFTTRMDVEALSDEALVAYGRKYARDMEYVIDDFGVLALHQRIDEMQTSDHVVTTMEVKEIVDAAIAHANRKSVGHFFDVLFSKRFDEEDMIILREKDFI